MKQNMIKLILSCCFSVLELYGIAQQTKIQYEYDEAGNRISRIQVQGIIRNQDTHGATAGINDLLSAAQDEKAAGLDVVLSDEKLNLYPNPTLGLLTITMRTWSDGDTGELVVMDANGRIVHQAPLKGTVTDIDLSNEPAGVYRINLKVGSKTGYYSVVKQ